MRVELTVKFIVVVPDDVDPECICVEVENIEFSDLSRSDNTPVADASNVESYETVSVRVLPGDAGNAESYRTVAVRVRNGAAGNLVVYRDAEGTLLFVDDDGDILLVDLEGDGLPPDEVRQVPFVYREDPEVFRAALWSAPRLDETWDSVVARSHGL